LKETRPLWPPQRGVGLQEPNLGKTNLRVSLAYSLGLCFAPSLADSFIFLTLTRLVVVFIFVNFSFALFTPPPPSRRLSTTHDKFGGKDQVHATNGICTKVNHVGRQSIICTLKHIFILNSILHIPQAK
jgi:hypothetical protein